jgi:hypothetical protein
VGGKLGGALLIVWGGGFCVSGEIPARLADADAVMPAGAAIPS